MSTAPRMRWPWLQSQAVRLRLVDSRTAAMTRRGVVASAVCVLASILMLSSLLSAVVTPPHDTSAVSAVCGCPGPGGPSALADVSALQPYLTDKKYAVATTVATDTYVPGILALFASLRATDPGFERKADYLALLGPEVDSMFISMLEADGIIPWVVPEWESGSAKFPSRWRGTFTKMHLAGLTNYDKVLFLDPDIISIAPSLDHLFANTLNGASSLASRWRLNDDGEPYCDGGAFMLRPASEHVCGLFCANNRVPGADWPQGEQKLLADYFVGVLDKEQEPWPGSYVAPCHTKDTKFIGQEDKVRQYYRDEKCVTIHYYGRKPWEPHWYHPWFYPGTPEMLTGVWRIWWLSAPARLFLDFPWASVFLAASWHAEKCWYIPPFLYPWEWVRYPDDPQNRLRPWVSGAGPGLCHRIYAAVVVEAILLALLVRHVRRRRRRRQQAATATPEYRTVAAASTSASTLEVGGDDRSHAD